MSTQSIARNRNQPAALVGKSQTPPDHPGGVLKSPVSSKESFAAPSAEFEQPTEPGMIPTFDSLTVDPNPPSAVAAPSANVPAYDPSAPAAHNAAINAGVAAPYLAEIEQIKKKRDVLRTMPITNKDGSTTAAWKVFGNEDDPEGEKARGKFTDTDGRLKSGFSAFVQSLAKNPGLYNIRDWDGLAKSLTFSAAAGVGGAIHSSWNEEQKRDTEMRRLDADEARLRKAAGEDMKLATAQTNIEAKQSTQKRLDKSLDERVNQNKVNNLQKEKVEFLRPILARGYFYEADATPAEKEEMQRLNITLPDFDKTRPAYNDKGGVRKVWDVQTRSYLAAQGDDEDDPMIPVEIDGQRMNLTPAQFANYKATEHKTQYDTQVKDADNEQEYKQALTKWEEDERKRGEDNVKLVNDANTKNTEAIEQENLANDYESEAKRLAEDNPTEAVRLRSLARQAKAKAGVLKTESGSLMNRAQNSKSVPKPVKQSKLPTYSSNVQATGKYSGKTFPNPTTLRNAFPGKSDADIKQIIEANGGKFAQ